MINHCAHPLVARLNDHFGEKFAFADITGSHVRYKWEARNKSIFMRRGVRVAAVSVLKDEFQYARYKPEWKRSTALDGDFFLIRIPLDETVNYPRDMLTKNDVYEMGRDRGIGIAMYQDVIEIGSHLDTYIAGEIGYDIVDDEEEQEEIWFHLCGVSESMDRDYTPFEFTAKALNDLQEVKPYEVWDEYERGIQVGFRKIWNGRKKEMR